MHGAVEISGLQTEKDISDTGTGGWAWPFWETLWKEHVRQYLRLLSTSPFSGRLSAFDEFMSVTGIDRFPGGILSALEFCRQWGQSRSRMMPVMEWISGCSPDRESYRFVLEWAAQEENVFTLDVLARIPSPPDLEPDEQKAAAAVWRKKLQGKKSHPFFYVHGTPLLSVYDRLYLLSDDPVERLQIFQEVPLLSMDPTDADASVWSERLKQHCRQYPDDETRLREHYLDCIYRHDTRLNRDDELRLNSYNPDIDGPADLQFEQYLNYRNIYLGGWLGIVWLGAGEDESRLLEIVRAHFNRQTFGESTGPWQLLSMWQPVSPSVRAELLKWWHAITDRNDTDRNDLPLSRFRSFAIFSLEDESRLVEQLEQMEEETVPPEIPDGWHPRCPQLQMRLIKPVIGQLRFWVAAHHMKSHKAFACHQDYLWGLLFRLPVSGSHLLDLVGYAVVEESPVLARIQQLLQSPGLPRDTSPQDIRDSVDSIVASIEEGHLYTDLTENTQLVMKLSLLSIELLREYVRLVSISRPDGEGSTPSVPTLPTCDTSWVDARLDFFTRATAEQLSTDRLVRNILHAWRGRHLPGTAFILHRLWLSRINELGTCLAPSAPDRYNDPRLEALLLTLVRLAPHMVSIGHAAASPADPLPAGEMGFSSGELLPPNLLEVLSDLTLHTGDEFICLLAGALGSHLLRHTGPEPPASEQQTAWWGALSGNTSFPAESGDSLSALVCQAFLFDRLFEVSADAVQASAPEPPGGATRDTTTVLRFLRPVMHLFPDPPAPGNGFWNRVWEQVFEVWRMEHSPVERKGKVLPGVDGPEADGPEADGMGSPEFIAPEFMAPEFMAPEFMVRQSMEAPVADILSRHHAAPPVRSE